jgi:hypothetical protein
VYVTNAETSATIALAEVQDMYFSNEGGSSSFIRGDVNNDGTVSISDVAALIDYMIDNTTVINLDAADCNADQNVSIADVSALIDYLLNHSW